jgi:hypothetical protein
MTIATLHSSFDEVKQNRNQQARETVDSAGAILFRCWLALPLRV